MLHLPSPRVHSRIPECCARCLTCSRELSTSWRQRCCCNVVIIERPVCDPVLEIPGVRRECAAHRICCHGRGRSTLRSRYGRRGCLPSPCNGRQAIPSLTNEKACTTVLRRPTKSLWSKHVEFRLRCGKISPVTPRFKVHTSIIGKRRKVPGAGVCQRSGQASSSSFPAKGPVILDDGQNVHERILIARGVRVLPYTGPVRPHGLRGNKNPHILKRSSS